MNDFSIFDNQEEVVDNIRDSAEKLGTPTDGLESIKKGELVPVFVAKSKCKLCWGRGILSIIPDRCEDLTQLRCRCVRVRFV